jgi:NCS1 family nucleobase:cation symporter-1
MSTDARAVAGPSQVNEEVHFNLLPLRRRDRSLGFWDFLVIQISFGIAAWYFLAGSLVGLTVTARDAVPIILFGNSIPLLLLAPLAAVFARYGVEHWLGSSAVLGHRLKDIWLFICIATFAGWLAFPAWLFGLSATKFVARLGGPDFLTKEVPGGLIFAYIALGLGAYLAFRGPNVLKWFTRIGTVFMLLVLGWLTWSVLRKAGVSGVYGAQPAEPFETLALSRASAIEFNVGLGFSWAFAYGQWTRLAKSERSAFHGCLWGWGIGSLIAVVFAAFVALSLGIFDPTEWIVTLGLAATVIGGLALFAVANISSIGILAYSTAISFRSRFPKAPWLAAVLVGTIPAVALSNPVAFENYGKFLAYVALLTGVYGGIMVADYYVVSRGNWSLSQLYNRRDGYRYWKGFNPVAVIATLAGAGFYLWTLNPLTWTSANGLFPYITAGIPSFFVSFITYGVLMRVWLARGMMVQPALRGEPAPAPAVVTGDAPGVT